MHTFTFLINFPCRVLVMNGCNPIFNRSCNVIALLFLIRLKYWGFTPALHNQISSSLYASTSFFSILCVCDLRLDQINPQLYGNGKRKKPQKKKEEKKKKQLTYIFMGFKLIVSCWKVGSVGCNSAFNSDLGQLHGGSYNLSRKNMVSFIDIMQAYCGPQSLMDHLRIWYAFSQTLFWFLDIWKKWDDDTYLLVLWLIIA